MEKRSTITSLAKNKDTFLAFYLLIKVHKTPWKTCPIVSFASSLLYPLGTWLSHYMHDIANTMPTFLENSKQLKEDLVKLNVPPGAKIFTVDAMSMYTNLKTKFAMNTLRKHFTYNQDKIRHLPLKAIKTAMAIIITLNVFTFGDNHFLRLTRGTPPAPYYAQTTFDTHEVYMIAHFIQSLFLYKHYINNICDIWVPKSDAAKEETEWRAFKTLLDTCFGPELEVIVSNKSADFMDLTITLEN
eukprot:11171808-Ditylum_brightwellii.AAC.1